MASDEIKLRDEISAQFAKGGVLTASDEKLQEYIMSLSSGHVPNDMVRHREIIRALTINHIQMKRHIDGLNKQNSFTQKCVIALTIAALIGTIVQIYYADKSEKRSEAQERRIAIEQQKQKSK